MRVPKALLVEPGRNTLYGVVAVSLSYFVFAYSTLFGKPPILIYYSLWLPLVLVDYRRTLGGLPRCGWLLVFPVLACLSVFWSRAPGVTERAAVQYATHVACILIAARTISPRTFTLGSLAGALVVVLYSLADGRHVYDPLDGTYTLVGAFSSKNQLGLFASLGIYFSFCSLWIYREHVVVRAAAIVVGAVSAYALHAADSATSVIGVTAAIAAVVGASLLTRFAPGKRGVLLVGSVMLCGGLAFVAIQSGAVELVLGAFNKNTTLTGRTYLWAQGLAESKQAPLLGVGYQAYWVQGFPGPELLWEKFYIASRTGFHFHDTYIETLVELGYVGAILLAVALVAALVGHTRRLVAGVNPRGSQLMFGVAILLLVRSFVEVDILAPYQVGSFLLYYAAGLLATPKAAAARQAAAGRVSRSPAGGWAPRPGQGA